MKKLGLIINPIAGMGGSVGLKGTDNTAAEAFRRGAVPRAGDRAKAALSELLPVKEEILVYTCPGAMGGDTAEEMLSLIHIYKLYHGTREKTNTNGKNGTS